MPTHQALKQRLPKQPHQGLTVPSLEGEEAPVSAERAIGRQHMQVRVPAQAARIPKVAARPFTFTTASTRCTSTISISSIHHAP
jgi:hypothetical protein